MGDYFAHWLDDGRHADAARPKIFRVNWFRTDDDGKFLWPGFGENLRVLKWVLERCDGSGAAMETPIGSVPTLDAIDPTGVDRRRSMAPLLRVDPAEWVEAVPARRTSSASSASACRGDARGARGAGAPHPRRHGEVGPRQRI